MQRPAPETPTTTQSDNVASSVTADPLQQRSSFSMAATTSQLPQTLHNPGYRDQRPTLPPLTSLENIADRYPSSPLVTPPISQAFGSLDPFQHQLVAQPSPTTRNVGTDLRYQQSGHPSRSQGSVLRDPFRLSQHQGGSSSPHEPCDNPLKRSYGAMTHAPTRYTQPPQIPAHPTYPDPRLPLSQSSQAQLPTSTRSSYSDASTPSQSHSISSYVGPGTAQETRSVIAGSTTSRLSLHIRQQPRAARAGPDGKDRRAIDPPPILQLMIDDFDLDNDDDINELRSSYFVVHCRLISATAPKKDLSTTQTLNEDGTIDIQRLLLGTTVASPFFCQDDPDPENMPQHPVTSTAERPPSPSSRFIQSRSQTKVKEKSTRPQSLPGSFFIFADLSVRKAGDYRLEFCLMKIEASSMMAGKSLPITHTVHSQVFKVVNAKDFDQVQPSTELVKGLLDRGAGFPLKLKKGIREGQRRRHAQGESDDDDEEDDVN